MSISRAPSLSTLRASMLLISGRVAPNGNPITDATRTSVPRRRWLARLTHAGLTHTEANPYSRASSQRRSMSSAVASGLRSVWSMYLARSIGTSPPVPW